MYQGLYGRGGGDRGAHNPGMPPMAPYSQHSGGGGAAGVGGAGWGVPHAPSNSGYGDGPRYDTVRGHDQDGAPDVHRQNGPAGSKGGDGRPAAPPPRRPFTEASASGRPAYGAHGGQQPSQQYDRQYDRPDQSRTYDMYPRGGGGHMGGRGPADTQRYAPGVRTHTDPHAPAAGVQQQHQQQNTPYGQHPQVPYHDYGMGHMGMQQQLAMQQQLMQQQAVQQHVSAQMAAMLPFLPMVGAAWNNGVHPTPFPQPYQPAAWPQGPWPPHAADGTGDQQGRGRGGGQPADRGRGPGGAGPGGYHGGNGGNGGNGHGKRGGGGRPEHAALSSPPAIAALSDPAWRSREGHVYTVLTRNITRLVAQLMPTQQEVWDKEQVLAQVRDAAEAAFPDYRRTLRVEPFGSYLCGLGTRASDIDVVLVGIAEPSQDLGFYSRDERPRIARLLDRLIPQLRQRLRLTRCLIIRHSRVPIVKITTSNDVSVDISIASRSGPQAAEYVREQVIAYPPLRPLVLVLKTYMKAEGLAEVATGGLSSYGLTFMVLAHLMEEGKRGTPPAELGWLLHTAVRRYGRSFNVGSMAVSVGHGGLVNKAVLGWSHVDHGDRIVAIDPLTSRNCTEGTFRTSEVLAALGRADAYLSRWAAKPDAEVPDDADILGPLLQQVPDEDAEAHVQEYRPSPAQQQPRPARGVDTPATGPGEAQRRNSSAGSARTGEAGGAGGSALGKRTREDGPAGQRGLGAAGEAEADDDGGQQGYRGRGGGGEAEGDERHARSRARLDGGEGEGQGQGEGEGEDAAGGDPEPELQLHTVG